NAALAHAVLEVNRADANRLFEPVSHPSFHGGDAPYCAFRLRKGDEQAYDRIERWLEREAEQRRVVFERGGSFGFRGDRLETVRPKDAGDAFLRVAMGRRGGWSCEGAIALMRELASRTSLP